MQIVLLMLCKELKMNIYSPTRFLEWIGQQSVEEPYVVIGQI